LLAIPVATLSDRATSEQLEGRYDPDHRTISETLVYSGNAVSDETVFTVTLLTLGAMTTFSNSVDIVEGLGSKATGAFGVGLGLATLYHNSTAGTPHIALEFAGVAGIVFGVLSFEIDRRNRSNRNRQLRLSAFSGKGYRSGAMLSIGF